MKKNQNYIIPYTDEHGRRKYIIAPNKEDWERLVAQHDYEIRVVSSQMVFDATEIALHQEFGFGEERQRRFKDASEDIYNSMRQSVRDEIETDPEAVYAIEQQERALRAATGKYYVERKERFKLY